MKAKKSEKLPEMCDKKRERGQKICEMVESEEDAERCNRWIEAKHVACTENGKCKIQMKGDKQLCSARFQDFMQGIWKDDYKTNPDNNSESVGFCFTQAMDSIAKCTEEASAIIDEANAGFEPPTEEEIAAFKQAMKDQRKNKAKQNKRQRQNKRKNRRSNWQQKKSQWNMRKKQWEKE